MHGAIPHKVRIMTSLKLEPLSFSTQENRYTASYPMLQKLHTGQGLEFLFFLFFNLGKGMGYTCRFEGGVWRISQQATYK